MNESVNITELDDIDKTLDRFNMPVRLEYDTLTGLLCRSSFLEKAGNDIPDLLKRYDQAVIITLDLKDMKGFNSSYGQEEGDRLLCEIADILKQHFGNEHCSRFGEDRYYVFTRAVGIEIELDGIIKQIQNINNGHTLPVRMGICSVNDSTSVDIACDRARMACDTLRSNYNSGFVWFDEKLADENTKKDYIIKHLDQAIEEEWIQVYLQPVVRTLTGELCGFEALSRWKDPRYGLMTPGDYIYLLEQNRISYKLDNYMITKVAEILRKRQDENLPVVPISVNFSRTDFVINDPVKVVSEVVNRYGIRKNLISIEITESSIVSDDGAISTAISRFHDEGFSVIMDDFGSGYSSLNFLKDFFFDEIKIDLDFFQHFNDRAKTIVSMIIEMAKKLGMHTLAEGVETEEHLEFLKSVGCEKIQGLYFGKAMHHIEMLSLLQSRSMKWEARNYSIMYDKAGLTNVIVDTPAALFLFDGNTFKGLFSNEEFNRTLLTAGYKDLEAIEADMNMPESPKGRKCRDLAFKAKKLNSGQYMTFLANNNYYKLSFKIIADSNESYILYTSMDNLVYDHDRSHTSELDIIARKIMFNYDSIHYVDINEHKGSIIASNIPSEKVGDVIDDAEKYYSEHVLQYIHPTEQERWKQFVSSQNVQDSLKVNQRGNFSALFRMRQIDGSYEWTEFTVTSFRGSNAHKLLVSSKPAIINDPSAMAIVERLVRHNYRNDEQELDVSGNIWDILINKSDVKFFWKDRNFRFLGASKAFYDYYCMTPDQIIGKTNEEIGWHVDSSISRKTDMSILNKGESVHEAIRQTIVKGVVHRIAMTKYPLYHRGKIYGIMGSFLDMEEMQSKSNTSGNLNLVDPVTGLMDGRGLMIASLELNDNYRKNRINYMHVVLDVAEYTDIQEDYGDTASQELLLRVADILRATFKDSFILARTSGGQFSICKATTSFNDMVDLVQRAEAEIHAITLLNGIKCSVHADYGIARASEAATVQDVVNLAYTRMKKKRLEEY
ncbi:EAL domain-containing protein [Oribacterium sp. WCC10]|uniref:EAL domain-containing protein n=1 Tax=Oribacterium sp. WCC10 TaxID=1855343 RepID=UPI0008E525A8|nr:EAL domain-containing protein [Oribacterium sp. WCC10]SFG62235.1 diguanylate cyclase (GGDEF) domain-containing protein [Oribacterium sp. WCC10]